MGIHSVGAIDTRVNGFGSTGAEAGITFERTPDNLALSPTSSVAASLATGFMAHGFSLTGESSWSFDHCAAFGRVGAAFSPDDAHVTSPVRVDPILGACTEIYRSPPRARFITLRPAGPTSVPPWSIATKMGRSPTSHCGMRRAARFLAARWSPASMTTPLRAALERTKPYTSVRWNVLFRSD